MIAEQEPGLVLYGELADELFAWVEGERKAPEECLAEGPAGTGKTRTILEMLRTYGENYPRSKIVFLRNERAAMSETLLVEWEEFVLGPDHYCVRGGPQRKDREKYTFTNGSEFILRGFDNEQKLFSGQYHVIYFNEATELRSEEKWETLHRAKRAKNTHGQPFRMLLADCNPRQKSHWLNRRAHDPDRAGLPFVPLKDRMQRIRGRLEDNPRWYDHDRREWTKDGKDYITSMSRGFTGVNRERLLYGLWSNAEGALLPEWNPGVHVIDATLAGKSLTIKGWDRPVEIEWTFAAMDAGYEDSGVLGVWGMDDRSRMFRLAEIYRRHWTHDDWAQHVVKLAREFRLQHLACDHDKALIAALNRALVNAGFPPFVRIADKTLGMSGDKAKTARIELLRSRLVRQEIFWVKNANRELDPWLQEKNRPYRSEDEFPNLRYEEFTYGEDKIEKEARVDQRDPDHGLDETLYAVAYATTRAFARAMPEVKYAPGTAGHILNHNLHRRPIWKPGTKEIKQWASM